MVGFSNTYMNAVAHGFFYALNSGCLTLASQHFGASQFREIGECYYKTLVFNLLVFFLSLLLIGCSQHILFALGSEWAFSVDCWKYMLCGIPTVLVNMGCDVLKNFLNAQQVYVLPCLAQAFCYIVVFWPVCYSLTVALGLHYYGVIVSMF